MPNDLNSRLQTHTQSGEVHAKQTAGSWVTPHDNHDFCDILTLHDMTAENGL